MSLSGSVSSHEMDKLSEISGLHGKGGDWGRIPDEGWEMCGGGLEGRLRRGAGECIVLLLGEL